MTHGVSMNYKEDLMEFLDAYMIPVIVGICLCVGYIIKHWIKDVDNKFIPTIVLIIGTFISVWMNGWNVTPDILLSGMVSGLGSTGLYELFRQYIDKHSDK